METGSPFFLILFNFFVFFSRFLFHLRDSDTLLPLPLVSKHSYKFRRVMVLESKKIYESFLSEEYQRAQVKENPKIRIVSRSSSFMGPCKVIGAYQGAETKAGIRRNQALPRKIQEIRGR